MKVVLLAGGLGTRISEETESKPKPMVEIGGMPILWHIMKIYSYYGLNDFVICCGYKGYVIKEYFANYCLHMSDVTFSMDSNTMKVHNSNAENWSVSLIDTGEETMTGGRLRRVREFLGDEEFCFTYGDGLSDVDISALLKFHRSRSKLATVTAVKPPGRYGAIEIGSEGLVESFVEKPSGDGGYINGGFFVLDPRVLDYIADDGVSWEGSPLRALVSQGELAAFKHDGFWQPMDTLREKNYLNDLWVNGCAPWKVWA